jgi:hypothetical protein
MSPGLPRPDQRRTQWIQIVKSVTKTCTGRVRLRAERAGRGRSDSRNQGQASPPLIPLIDVDPLCACTHTSYMYRALPKIPRQLSDVDGPPFKRAVQRAGLVAIPLRVVWL